MSALGDVAAAMLPPEHGGPAPERIASASRHLLWAMPPANRAALGAVLVGIEGAALARHGRPLGALPPVERARVLGRLASLGPAGSAAIDALKAVVLMAAGSCEHAAAIAATGSAVPPSRPDPELDLVDALELGYTRVDAIVIGSGAGGAFCARELARAGLATLVVEEGERWDSERIRGSHPLRRFAGLYRDGGSTIALGHPAVALPIGRAVGGTTVVNSGTCYRPPASVIEEWRDEHGLALAGGDLDERLAEVEETISVGRVPLDVMGRNGRLALEGAERLGLRSGPLLRNAPGCRGVCQCAIGCPNNAKSGVHLNALPEACEAGARIVTGARVERVLTENGAAVGVRVRRRDGSSLELRAPRVIVAAGTTETPPLLRRSGLGAHPRLGKGMSVHPALGIGGRFEEVVTPWEGVLQSAGVEEYHGERGILLEATSTPPGMGSMMLPGFGQGLIGEIGRAEAMATLGVMIADGPSGAVHGSSRPLLSYRISREDSARLREGLGHAAEVLLAAGAYEVELGGGHEPLRDADEVDRAIASLDLRTMHLAAFHPTGTAAAGSEPAHHPTGPDGRLRGVEGVWVGDASIIPSCPTVNPQLSIMSLAIAVGRSAATA